MGRQRDQEVESMSILGINIYIGLFTQRVIYNRYETQGNCKGEEELLSIRARMTRKTER
jgi:hypothetical protein